MWDIVKERESNTFIVGDWGESLTIALIDVVLVFWESWWRREVESMSLYVALEIV